MNIAIHSKDFVSSMKTAMKVFNRLVMRSLERTAEMGAAYAKTSTLFKFRTGALRSSIQHGMKGEHAAQMSANAKHARWIEEGTKPHIIRARRKKWMRFEQNGAIRFAKIVHHPGTKPRPFMQQARDKVEPLFERLCHEAVQNMFS